MKSVLIVEKNTSALTENIQTIAGKKEYIMGGPFTDFGVLNRNSRIYTAEKFLPCLEELTERMTNLGIVYGEFDHPDVFDTSLSRASHIIKSTTYVKESNRVEGKIKLLSTYWGKEARSLVDDGCPIFVSSRAAGITESDGTVSLKKLFTYDIVADPGFASAKMSSMNESCGYSNESNFRIYEMSDESKINDLFNMNKNDFVTKQQLEDYSKFLITEISTTKKAAQSAIKKGNINPEKLEKLLEYYEELNKTNNKMVDYLDYLADKIQVVVSENIQLKSTTEKLISHNDYLAENLEKSINYSEYLSENVNKNIEYSEYIAEKVDKNIEYSEYLAETVDKNIAYSEYIAEKVDKNIVYAEYLAENLDKNIGYAEYIAENLDKNIAYAEYIAENLDKNIVYSEYLAESLDNSIAYSEYLSEHVEGNIAYSEYIAEHLDDNIAYSEYIAESLDKTVSYAGLITEKLNGGKLNENKTELLPTLEDMGFSVFPDDEYLSNHDDDDDDDDFDDEFPDPSMENDIHAFVDEETIDNEEEDDMAFNDNDRFIGESDTELSLQIDKLIEEAKKRKVSESNDLHFLKFLNKSQIDSYYSLTNEEQEQVKLYISERSYFTGSEVLKMIQECLSVKNETLEDRLIRLMPENIKPMWSEMNESAKKSILSQARLYPELTTESKIEHFWNTRPFKKNESLNKKLVSHNPIIQEDKLGDNDVKSIMERFKNL
jgi:hypothetical protein